MKNVLSAIPVLLLFVFIALLFVARNFTVMSPEAVRQEVIDACDRDLLRYPILNETEARYSTVHLCVAASEGTVCCDIPRTEVIEKWLKNPK